MAHEKKDRNEEIVVEVKKLREQDIKRSAEKVAKKYNISARRVFAIMKHQAIKKANKND